ncbi:MAG: hypothetical protein DRQ78_05250 [Epsilonproteobacteria bacterium]|nr:MAG: hypothetical protein DRQ78_05250 [Campylobacterota bacterium]
MTYKIWIRLSIILLVLNGCTPVAPNLNDTTHLSSDTVSINENSYGDGNYNSSSDNFKSVYFNFGEYGISSKMDTLVEYNAQNANTLAGQIKIEGNCDEFGTDEYNYALGLKRAKAVKDALVSQGVDTSKILIVSFGESSPVCVEPSDSCYDQNRRVDIRLVQ